MQTDGVPGSIPPPAFLVSRAVSLVRDRGRVILGIAGPPGAGKSTLAAALVCAIGPIAVVVGMDGFHLSDGRLRREGTYECKGAPGTFDVEGYIALLRRLRDPVEAVYAPVFDRRLEASIGGELRIDTPVRLVITEGNYLLGTAGGWEEVRPLLDECWYVDVDDEIRRERLVARHRQFGRSRDEARTRAHGVDETNAELVRSTRGRADLVHQGE